MRSRFASCVIVLLAFAGVTQAEKARNSGPWDLTALAAPPKFEFGPKEGSIQTLYYAGQPYRGKPTRVFAYLAMPEKIEGKLPAMVLVHGGGGKAFREWAELWAKRGYIAIAMDLAGKGPDGKRLEDGGPDQTDKEKFYDIAGGVKDAWPYHAVANVIGAVSLLRSLDQVDPQRIGITGISWGGYLTCLVAGLDERLKVAVPVYGCGFLHDNSAWLPTFAKLPPSDRQQWIENFDPSKYLANCSLPILFVNGTNDFAYPLDSYQKSYRLVRGPRSLCVTVRMPHGHPPGWAPKEIGLFVDSILKEGTPLPRVKAMTRDGQAVSASFASETPITKAELCYTTDKGKWQDRKWTSVPATLEKNKVQATLPKPAPTVYYLTLTDDRGAVVSTEHVEEK